MLAPLDAFCTLLAAADTMRLFSFGFQSLIVRTEAGASTLN